MGLGLGVERWGILLRLGMGMCVGVFEWRGGFGFGSFFCNIILCGLC